ncbi:MAG: 4Fe-4S dicluster domain-containing protein [Candidatus Fermentibacteraceae bacterium]|nr:4Fe-4S dicluster domain-containing protein [Candidatus Fermentibacteraceae bacterium]
MLFIKRGDFDRLLESLKGEFRVYVPRVMGNGTGYSLLGDSDKNFVIGEIRSFDPLKAFFFLGREKVAEDFSPDIPRDERPPCIVGAKACDLKGFRILDFVFMDEEYGDPTYIRARKEGLIISADCTGVGETCFCTAVDVSPWPEADFDINLSPVEGGFLVAVGSEKGKKLVDEHGSLFSETEDKELLDSVKKNRSDISKQVAKNVKKKEIPSVDRLKRLVQKQYEESDLWKESSEDCVECGACNVICPTCHCFLLYDQRSGGKLARYRVWDSCMIKDFARVAGGENPRDRLWMRLRNRFDKKFNYFPEVASEIACTGCGRCIAACPGKIDIREVLARLEV